MLDRTPKREGKRSGGWEMRNRRGGEMGKVSTYLDILTSVMSLIIQTIQLFEHLPFLGKMINFCIPSIRTLMFEIIFQYPNTYTLQSSNGGR